jgi:hypothetical protein
MFIKLRFPLQIRGLGRVEAGQILALSGSEALPLLAAGNASSRPELDDDEDKAFQERKRRAAEAGQNVDWDKDPRYQGGLRSFFSGAPTDQADDGFAEKLTRTVRQLARARAPRASLAAGALAEEESFGEKLKRAVDRKQEQARKPAPQPTEEAKQDRQRWLRIEKRG